MSVAAHVTGITRSDIEGRRHSVGFPLPVARIENHLLWRCSDIEAYAQGARDFAHPHGVMQDDLLFSEEIAVLTGVPVNQVPTRASQQRWHKVPRPSGRISRRLYWLRTDVERWSAARG